MPSSLQSFEATVQTDGSVKLKRRLRLKKPAKAMLTILVDPDPDQADVSSARLSETSLAQDWSRAEEDEAWAHLQPER